MNSVHEQCPISDSKIVLSQKLVKCTMCTHSPASTPRQAHWPCRNAARAPLRAMPRACAPPCRAPTPCLAPLRASACAPSACASSAYRPCEPPLARPCMCAQRQRLLSAFAPVTIQFHWAVAQFSFAPNFILFFFSFPSVAFLATSTCSSLNIASIQLNNFMSSTLKFIKILFHYPITQIKFIQIYFIYFLCSSLLTVNS